MRLRLLTLSALALQIALGNVCFMQMPSTDMSHEMQMESKADCDHCSKEVTAKQPADGMDCASGHCFMQSATTVTSNPDSPHAPMIIAAGLANSPLLFVSFVAPDTHQSTAPPGLPTYTDTIVLRS